MDKVAIIDTNTVEPSPPSDTDDSPEQATRTMLAGHSQKIMQSFDLREVDEDFLLEYLSPNFEAAIEDFPTASTAAEHIANIKQTAQQYPSWTLEVLNTTTMLYDKGRKAKVFVTLSVKGLPLHGFEASVRESACMIKWRRVSGKRWICTKWVATRGPGTFRG